MLKETLEFYQKMLYFLSFFHIFICIFSIYISQMIFSLFLDRLFFSSQLFFQQNFFIIRYDSLYYFHYLPLHMSWYFSTYFFILVLYTLNYISNRWYIPKSKEKETLLIFLINSFLVPWYFFGSMYLMNAFSAELGLFIFGYTALTIWKYEERERNSGRENSRANNRSQIDVKGKV